MARSSTQFPRQARSISALQPNVTTALEHGAPLADDSRDEVDRDGARRVDATRARRRRPGAAIYIPCKACIRLTCSIPLARGSELVLRY